MKKGYPRMRMPFLLFEIGRNFAEFPSFIVLGKQFLCAATSVGANLEEAYPAQSRRDFLHKCRIALKEARESHYWLRLTRESDIVAATKLDDLVSETNEIVAVLTTIVKKTAHNLDDK